MIVYSHVQKISVRSDEHFIQMFRRSMNVKILETDSIINLETIEGREHLRSEFSTGSLSELPIDHRYRFSWNTREEQYILKVQKPVLRFFWKTVMEAPVQPLNDDFQSLMEEVYSVSEFLSTRLYRRLFLSL